jgi:signal transduction histidine kinase
LQFGNRIGGVGRDRSAWLVPLFLLLGVVAPTAVVVWFMNEAARSQADAARQSVTEAYRGQLRFLRDRLEAFWEARAARVLREAGAGTPADFQRSVTRGLADSLVYLKRDGSVAYPAATTGWSADPLEDRADWRTAQGFEERRNWLAAARVYTGIAKQLTNPSAIARAAQAQIRATAQAGDKEGAIRAIGDYFSSGPPVRGADLVGRLIAADEHLLALRLMPAGDRRRPAILRRLTALLNDYQNAMPAAQRLFLMGEVQGKFATLEAERLAAQYVEAAGRPTNEPGLRRAPVNGLWSLAAKGGRVIALYRTETVLAAMRRVLDENKPARAVKFAVVPPGEVDSGESLQGGPFLPGWQVSFTFTDTQPLEEAARNRMASYLWAGYLVVAAMVLTGLVAGQAFRRQLRLTRLKTDLVAAVSHELKTPLASMRLLVDALLDDSQFDPKKTREYLQLIAGENVRLTRLIENFLTFSRIERNRQRFEFRPARPADVVQSAVAAVRERFQGCALDVHLEADLPEIHADEDALVTVLLNLLDNAYKYTRDDRRIALRAWRENGSVLFAVEDNGIGIPAREHRRIFRRFYQVDRRLARETGGCGLGLSIVEFIVRAHGGTVGVRSKPGAGSTFTVSLPCGAEQRAAA